MDNETFLVRFTLNSLQDIPLSGDMKVYAKWDDINFQTYNLKGLLVKTGILGDVYINPDDMTDEDKNLYNAIIDMYGRKLEISTTSIKFSGSVLSFYNPASYKLLGERIVFTDNNLNDTFTTNSFAKGKVLLGVVNDGIGFVFEYHGNDYIEPAEVSFNYNGATSGNTVTNKKLVIGEAIGTLPEPEKTGYTFDGWYLDGGYKISEDYICQISVNFELYAKWNVITYNISYTLNGGDETNNPTTYNVESDDIYLVDSYKEGYDFTGWYDNNYDKIKKISKGSVGDKSLQARFAPKSYRITYKLNGGTNSYLNPSNYTIETETFNFFEPTKTGYTFVGWYDNAEFSGEKITSVSNGSTSDITLYAKWEVITYNISYTLNGGDETSNPTTYNVESNDIILLNAVKNGYVFLGWYDNNNNKVEKISKGSVGDISLQARFAPTKYSISYNLDGGTNHPSNPTGYTIETETFSFFAPTKTGYTFVGWFDNGEVKTTVDLGSTGNIALSARYTANSYTLTFDYKDAEGNIGAGSKTVTYDSAIGELPAPTKNPYTFGGWFTAENGGGYKIDSEYVYKTVGNTTVYPYWLGTSGLTYTVSGNSAEVSGNPGTAGNVVIAPYYFGKPVKTVKVSAFANNTNITSVNIPSTVTTIKENAFGGCTNLTSLGSLNSVTSIGYYAFGNTAITELTIPASAAVSYGIVSGCNSLVKLSAPLKEVYSNSTNSYLGYYFSASSSLLGYDSPYITIPQSLKEVEIVGINTRLSSCALYNFTNITKATIPSTVTEIGEKAFYNCGNLVEIVNLGTIAVVGNYAFKNCVLLESIANLNGLTKVGEEAFSGCLTVKTVNFIGDLSIGICAFANCTNLTSINLGNSLSSIGYYAFGNTAITELTIPASAAVSYGIVSGCNSLVKLSAPLKEEYSYNANSYLGYYFIYDNNKLGYDSPYITIPQSLKEVEIVGINTRLSDYAVYNFTNITKATIPSTVTEIGSYAFSYCGNLVEIGNLGTIAVIGNSSFYNCLVLESIANLNGLTKVGDSAFSGCLTVKTVNYIGDSSIGNYAFSNCTNLISINLGNRLSSIGYYAFRNTAITELTIPASAAVSYGIVYGCNSLVKLSAPLKEEYSYNANSYLGYYFIYDNNKLGYDSPYITIPQSLKEVEIVGINTRLSSCALYNFTNITKATIPSTVTEIGEYAFYNCGINFYTIHENVQSIKANAFADCKYLTAIYITNNTRLIAAGVCCGRTAIRLQSGAQLGILLFELCKRRQHNR